MRNGLARSSARRYRRCTQPRPWRRRRGKYAGSDRATTPLSWQWPLSRITSHQRALLVLVCVDRTRRNMERTDRSYTVQRGGCPASCSFVRAVLSGKAWRVARICSASLHQAAKDTLLALCIKQFHRRMNLFIGHKPLCESVGNGFVVQFFLLMMYQIDCQHCTSLHKPSWLPDRCHRDALDPDRYGHE